jgi:O-antigen/teichoic acid export membrane protein
MKKKNSLNQNLNIFKNFGYLSFIQIFNLIFPLILYPYIIRIIGAENYGEILYVQSIAIYLSLVVNFGFNIYGTNEISKGNTSEDISKIISNIFTCQIIFYCITLLILILIGCISQMEIMFFFLASYLCLNEIMIPVWYFQGKENMKYIAICSFISKLTALIFIFILVNDRTDNLYILLSYAIGSIVCGIFALFKIFKIDKNKIHIPKYEDIKKVLIDSFPLFVSHSLGGLTLKSNALFIGALIGKKELAYYDLAEKLVNLLSIFFQNFSNAIFPNIAKTKNKKLTRTALKIALISSVLIIIITNIISENLITIIGGIDMLPSIEILYLISFTLIFRAVGPIISTSIMVVNNLGNKLGTSFVFGSIVYFSGILILYLCNEFTVPYLIYNLTISLAFVVIFRIYYCIKNGLSKWII